MSNFLLKLTKTVLNPPKTLTIYTNIAFISTSLSVNKNWVSVVPNLKNRISSTNSNRTFKPTFASSTRSVQSNIASLQLKKRPNRKKKLFEDDDVKRPGVYNIVAYATAEEYDLQRLIKGLKVQDLYESKFIENASNVVHAVAKYRVENEPREIFFFREGSVVLWNVTDLESSNVLTFLRDFEHDSYTDDLVQKESEVMSYQIQPENPQTDDCSPRTLSRLHKSGDFFLSLENDVTLDKYTFSNAMVLSVKLGMWEALLEKYIETIEFVTEDLKKGNVIKMTQAEVLRKHGELFALRHLINLSSDLLDTPDFYWENEELENLYLQVCSYFCISKRTRVMNEKINHCVELIELLSSHLSDKHHVRLEWMIIILIMVEVAFETLHYIDRFMS